MKGLERMVASEEGREKVIRAFVQSALGASIAFGDLDNLFERQLVKSTFALQLVMFLERSFGIVIESEDLEIENFCSVHAISMFVTRKTAES